MVKQLNRQTLHSIWNSMSIRTVSQCGRRSTRHGLNRRDPHAVEAIARELCGFIWELLRARRCYQAQTPSV